MEFIELYWLEIFVFVICIPLLHGLVRIGSILDEGLKYSTEVKRASDKASRRAYWHKKVARSKKLSS